MDENELIILGILTVKIASTVFLMGGFKTLCCVDMIGLRIGFSGV